MGGRAAGRSWAVLSHETAAEVHGLIDKPSKIIHVTVAANRNPAKYGKIPGVVIHRSRRVVRPGVAAVAVAADARRGDCARPGGRVDVV